jgi:hypothetical protein
MLRDEPNRQRHAARYLVEMTLAIAFTTTSMFRAKAESRAECNDIATTTSRSGSAKLLVGGIYSVGRTGLEPVTDGL